MTPDLVIILKYGATHTHADNATTAQLSGGEQQRVAIARAFAANPPILLADEPTGNLDTETGNKIIDLLIRLHRKHENTMVWVTHDLDLAKKADRVIRLRDGKITPQ